MIDSINYFHIDFGGHIASSAMFERYGLHGRNPDRFHGLINNLFYPPLEDSIVWLIRKVTHYSHIDAFIFYVALLIIGYRGAIYNLIRQSKHRCTGLLMLIVGYVYFFLDKIDNISYLQGGGIVDLLFTGLTSQSLGIVFFLFFIGEYTRNHTRPLWLAIWSILTFLSHLVVGPVTFLLWGISIVRKWKYDHIVAFISSIGITSIFWLPFVAYKSLGTSALIVHQLPLLFIIIPLVGLYISYLKKHTILISLFLVSLLIIFPNYLSHRRFLLTGYHYPLPVFHYYRFASISVLCSLLAIVKLLDDYMQKGSTLYRRCVIGGLIIISVLSTLVYHVGITTPWDVAATIGNRDDMETDTVKLKTLYPVLDNGKKIFTIDINRPIDFGLDSYFQYMTPGLPFVKGLFRESSKGNQLVSSYIASLLSPQNIVLDFHYTNTREQEEYDRLWNSFIEQYNIGWIMIAPRDQLHYLDPRRNNMLFHVLSTGTSAYSFQPIEQLTIHGINYTLYKISSSGQQQISMGSDFVRLLTTKDVVVPIDTEKKHFSEDILSLYKNMSQYGFDKKMLFFDKKEIPGYNFPIGSTIPIIDILKNNYTIDLGMKETSIVLRLSSLPGWSISAQDGQQIGVYPGVYETIVTGSGKIIVSYHRTGIMIMAYIISVISLCSFIVFFIYKSRS